MLKLPRVSMCFAMIALAQACTAQRSDGSATQDAQLSVSGACFRTQELPAPWTLVSESANSFTAAAPLAQILSRANESAELRVAFSGENNGYLVADPSRIKSEIAKGHITVMLPAVRRVGSGWEFQRLMLPGQIPSAVDLNRAGQCKGPPQVTLNEDWLCQAPGLGTNLGFGFRIDARFVDDLPTVFDEVTRVSSLTVSQCAQKEDGR